MSTSWLYWTAPAHDAAGNMTTGVGGTNHTYKYDAWNRLTKVTTTAGATLAVYHYDGQHRQISRLVPNSSNWDRTDYYYSDGWQVLEERTSTVANLTTPATTPHIQWVWDTQYIDTPIRRLRDTANNNTWAETIYYTTDANRNVTALLDTSGNVVERTVYDAYGNPTFHAGASFATPSSTSSYANEVLFAGYRHDVILGIYHVRYRVYDPITGRWLQRDPEKYIAGMNLYQYCNSNPVVRIDPWGLKDYKLGTDAPRIIDDEGADAVKEDDVFMDLNWDPIMERDKSNIVLASDKLRRGLPNAVKHLHHYFDASGKTLTIDLKGMIKDVRSAKDLYNEELRQAKAFVEMLDEDMHFITSGSASEGYNLKKESLDWFLAVGGYQAWGRGVATVTCENGVKKYSLTFIYEFRDRYNWDADKEAEFLGIKVTDKYMGRFHRLGIAREFAMTGQVVERVEWSKPAGAGNPAPQSGGGGGRSGR